MEAPTLDNETHADISFLIVLTTGTQEQQKNLFAALEKAEPISNQYGRLDNLDIELDPTRKTKPEGMYLSIDCSATLFHPMFVKPETFDYHALEIALYNLIDEWATPYQQRIEYINAYQCIM